MRGFVVADDAEMVRDLEAPDPVARVRGLQAARARDSLASPVLARIVELLDDHRHDDLWHSFYDDPTYHDGVVVAELARTVLLERALGALDVLREGLSSGSQAVALCLYAMVKAHADRMSQRDIEGTLDLLGDSVAEGHVRRILEWEQLRRSGRTDHLASVRALLESPNAFAKADAKRELERLDGSGITDER